MSSLISLLSSCMYSGDRCGVSMEVTVMVTLQAMYMLPKEVIVSATLRLEVFELDLRSMWQMDIKMR